MELSHTPESVGLYADVDGRLVTAEVRDLYSQMRRRPMPSYAELGVNAARELVEGAVHGQGRPVSMDSVRDIDIDGVSGAICARLYKPVSSDKRSTKSSLLVYLHGGGWVTGSIDANDPMCRMIAEATGFTVASVDYGRPPEHPFPEPIDDARIAVNFLAGLRAELGLSTDRLVLAGDSAGAYLACRVVTGAASPVSDLVLWYPAVRPPHHEATESWIENAHDPILSAKSMTWFWEQLCGRLDLSDSRLSISRDSYSMFPRTHVTTCGLDPLRDEGVALATDVEVAGVEMHHVHLPGAPHGFFSFAKQLPFAVEACEQLADWLESGSRRFARQRTN